uniref:DUF5581 domain-containing protein n=1 Tax=Mus musculus TaxID=10090 RepID=Q9D9W3_MOUSE|nr:unnamed protein product [Mus musculus]
MERRNVLGEFLTTDLSPQLLKHHHARMQLLKKCSYYIEILPKHLALGDQNPLVLPNTMFQLIDSWKCQRMWKVGSSQTKIQLLLLGDLLEHLDHGRATLDALLEDPDPRYLSVKLGACGTTPGRPISCHGQLAGHDGTRTPACLSTAWYLIWRPPESHPSGLC